jgi:hypothetical protein
LYTVFTNHGAFRVFDEEMGLVATKTPIRRSGVWIADRICWDAALSAGYSELLVFALAPHDPGDEAYGRAIETACQIFGIDPTECGADDAEA